jgi:serine/threonine protein kinase
LKRKSVVEDLSDQEERLITSEDQKMIKEVASDINEKAFYGKILKKTNTVVQDQDLMKLSPRSREIATVVRFI